MHKVIHLEAALYQVFSQEVCDSVARTVLFFLLFVSIVGFDINRTRSFKKCIKVVGLDGANIELLARSKTVERAGSCHSVSSHVLKIHVVAHLEFGK
jgi:hypothetical protein